MLLKHKTTDIIVMREVNMEEKTYNVAEHNLEVPEQNNLIQRFATIQNISYEEAVKLIGGDNDDAILKNISNFTIKEIQEKSNTKLNRAQRRALKKKIGSKRMAQVVTQPQDIPQVISEATTKLNYIDLIQRLRKMNEKQENEINENANENN